MTVREISDQEVAFYLEHGWVKLEGLVSPDVVATLLRSATSEEAPAAGPRPSVVLGEAMGRNAQRLMNRLSLSDDDVAVRVHGEEFVVVEAGWRGMPYHQPSGEDGADRGGEVRLWVALDDMTSPLRFADGSHREGPLGSVLNYEGTPDLLAQYPKLAERLTPPQRLRAGDATVHHGFTVVGADETVAGPTVHLVAVTYVPADARYWTGDEARLGQVLSDERHPPVLQAHG